MTHPSEQLSALLDGELDAEELSRVTEHLATCTSCRRELEELNDARTALRSLVMVEPPPGVLTADDQQAKVVSLRRRPPVWVAAAAAAILALFVGIATLLAPQTTLEVGLVELSDQYGARTSLDPGITPGQAVPVLDLVEGQIE